MPATFTAGTRRKRMRWANGQGWTREVVRVPDVDDWDWRLSIAESDGPAVFSHLTGVERELILIKGRGLTLMFDDGAVASLVERYQHTRFSGECPVVGAAMEGPTEQLNLMWKRDRIAMSTIHEVTDDQGLLRNRDGIARSRAVDEPVDSLELEVAIARNTRDLRRQRGLSVADMASAIGISKAMLSKIENAQTSCSLSTLAALAHGLDVPVTSLFRGADTERQAAYVNAGRGTKISRNGTQAGHEYELLGNLRGEHRRLECLLVTLTENSETYPLFQHPGTEFIYMLEGCMDYGHGRTSYRLNPGDSLQFDGEGAHGPVTLLQVPIRFLSVVAFPDTAI